MSAQGPSEMAAVPPTAQSRESDTIWHMTVYLLSHLALEISPCLAAGAFVWLALDWYNLSLVGKAIFFAFGLGSTAAFIRLAQAVRGYK